MEMAEIERRTREEFPQWRNAALELRVIEKGGSGRLFVRVTVPGGEPGCIAMHYGLDRSDNARFAAVTDFLNRHGVPAPRILARREDLRLLWTDDLGSTDLGDLDGEDWSGVRKPAYECAFKAVFPLHCCFESRTPPDLPELERPFDASLYEWEQGYFLTNYAGRFLSREAVDALTTDPSLAELARELGSLPRSLVHRDFQSTNVMLQDGKAYLIDYQGLRWGLPEYDLASMVFDPYRDFGGSERDSLVDFYFGLKRAAGHPESRAEFERRLVRCGLQRLMQALGAYGFLGEEKGKREFLAHIPVARERLRNLAAGGNGLPRLAEILS